MAEIDRQHSDQQRVRRDAAGLLVRASALMLGLVCLVVLLVATTSAHGATSAEPPQAADARLDDLDAESQDFEAAIDTLERAALLDPDDPAPHLELGALELVLGHKNAAADALEDYQRLAAGP